MRLNMGCGHNKMPDYVNVDLFPEAEPDVLWDLEVTPWPWDDNSVDKVVFNHCLEHMGQDTRVFLGMMKELYRVCKDGAEIQINVPHPRCDEFIGDPTHVRIITPAVLFLFDREKNDEWEKQGGIANSPLAHYLHVDFRITNAVSVLREPYATQFKNGELAEETAMAMARELNNVLIEYRITLAARKSRSWDPPSSSSTVSAA
jgi:predicted SAM-dependent methyltransferase